MGDELNEVAAQVAVEVSKEVYKDVAHPGMKGCGEVLGLIPRAINAALVDARIWVEKREYKFAETKKLLEQRLANVSPKDIVPPAMHIAVPALQAIGFSMDSNEIREMYANLLAASMQKSIKNDVHPAYVELVKQLSPDEARILRFMARRNSPYPLSTLRLYVNAMSWNEVVPNFNLLYKDVTDLETRAPRRTVAMLDNLVRLGLLHIPEKQYLTSNGVYDRTEHDEYILTLKSQYHLTPDQRFEFDKHFVELTELGKAFCAICIGTASSRGLSVGADRANEPAYYS